MAGAGVEVVDLEADAVDAEVEEVGDDEPIGRSTACAPRSVRVAEKEIGRVISGLVGSEDGSIVTDVGGGRSQRAQPLQRLDGGRVHRLVVGVL